MVIGVMVLHTNLCASTFTWIGSSSTDWNDPNNWLKDGLATIDLPGSTDDVVFNAGSFGCLFNSPTVIHSLTITADYGDQITIPAGCNIYITGNLNIDIVDAWYIWTEKPNIILSGSDNQTINIVDYTNWTLANLTINKSGGTVTLSSYVKVIENYSNKYGTEVTPFTNLLWTCVPPQTGGIYHIANDFAL